MNISSLIFIIPRTGEISLTELAKKISELNSTLIEEFQIPKSDATIYSGIRNLNESGLVQIKDVKIGGKREKFVSLTADGVRWLQNIQRLIENSDSNLEQLNSENNRIDRAISELIQDSLSNYNQFLNKQIAILKDALFLANNMDDEDEEKI